MKPNQRTSRSVLSSCFTKATGAAGASSFSTSFNYSPLFQHDPSNLEDDEITEYKQILPSSAVSTTEINGQEFLNVSGDAMRTLSSTAFGDVAHLLRPKHLKQVRSILDDDEASDNDKFVALELLKNANIASGRVLPGCQDTGTGVCRERFCPF